MDKKDIYEHLAKIYLDASSKKKKKSAKFPWLNKHFFFVSLAVIALSLVVLVYPNYNRKLNSDTALFLSLEPIKINFNFDPAKKEVFAINLKGLDLTRFNELGFSARKTNPTDKITLKIEFTSNFRERSDIYIQDIPVKWQDYKINLDKFRQITKWSQVYSLSFIVEEWNAKSKKGVVYLDNVRFLL